MLIAWGLEGMERLLQLSPASTPSRCVLWGERCGGVGWRGIYRSKVGKRGKIPLRFRDLIFAEHLRPHYHHILYLTVSLLPGPVPRDWRLCLNGRAGGGHGVRGLHTGGRGTARSAPFCFKTMSASRSGTESTTKLEEIEWIMKGDSSLPPPVSRENLSKTVVLDFS